MWKRGRRTEVARKGGKGNTKGAKKSLRLLVKTYIHWKSLSVFTVLKIKPGIFPDTFFIFFIKHDL